MYVCTRGPYTPQHGVARSLYTANVALHGPSTRQLGVTRSLSTSAPKHGVVRSLQDNLPALPESTSRIVSEHWLERTQHNSDTVTICPPPSTVHFTHCLRTLAGENTAPSRHSDDLPPPLPQSTSRMVFGHWLERTQHHPDTVSICPPPVTAHFANCLRTLAGENTAPSRHSVDLLAPPQSTSRTVSSCL